MNYKKHTRIRCPAMFQQGNINYWLELNKDYPQNNGIIISSPKLSFKGTLMQISKSLHMFVFI